MEAINKLSSINYFINKNDRNNDYRDLIRDIDSCNKHRSLLDSINYISEDTYYNISKFKNYLNRLKETNNYDFFIDYLYFYRIIKGWSLATCVRAIIIYLRYDKEIDFSNLNFNKIFNLFMKIKMSETCKSSKCLDWRKLKQMFKFAGFRYDLTEFSFPEHKNKIKPNELITKDELKKICNELDKHQYGKGLEFKTFISVMADTGCRIGEMLSIDKEKLTKVNGFYQVVVDGKTGERNVVLLNSNKFLEQLINSGWRKWSFDYYAFYRQLNRVVKRLGIDKRVYSHLLRHGFSSFIAYDNTVSIEVKNKYCGWSAKSRMLETTYAHFSQRKVIDMMIPVLKKNPLF